MTPLLIRPILALGALAAVAAACGSGAPSESDVLASLADDVIVPRYDALAEETAALEGAVAGLCAAPSDAALGAARDAWRGASAAWAQSEASGVGPVMERRSGGLIAWPVVQPERIEALIAERPDLTAEAAKSEISSTQRGLGGVEHALFAGDAADALKQGSARCAYLSAVAGAAAAEAAAIRDEWTAYKDVFAGSSGALSASDSVAELVRTQVFLIRTIVDMRLAGALGLRGEPDPSAIPGGAAMNTLADLRNQVEGMRAVHQGAEGGLGVSALVAPLSAGADERMRERFAAALTALDAVGGPLRSAAAERSPEALAVHEALAALQTTLSTEVVSLLGVAVGFSDTDGDSLR